MAAGHGVVGWGIWDPPSRERVRECEIETDRQIQRVLYAK